MDKELYRLIVNIHLVLFGIFWLILALDTVLRKITAFINDGYFDIDDTIICKIFGFFAPDWINGDEVIFTLTLIALIPAMLATIATTWPLTHPILMTILTCYGLRFVVRTKKKIEKLTESTHNHKNEDNN